MQDWKEFLSKISATNDLQGLDALEHTLFGRKNGLMTIAMKELKDLDADKKKDAAVTLNKAKKELEEAIEMKRKEIENPSDDALATSDALDVTLPLPKEDRGHLHLIPEFIAQIEEVFGRMGFDVSYGPEVETEDLNFDKLNIPASHPARDMQDTFWVETKEGDKVLRTHTSPVQIRYMLQNKPPFRMVCPGRVYRKDSDATHSPMFHQFEGLMIGKDISLANLQSVLTTAMKELISQNLTFRWRTGYFPFTEPSLEMDIAWEGDTSDSREGKWLEMGGCGMVHPNVLRNVGIDPEKWQGFAFGFGIERPLMIKHQIPDLREFYQGNLEFLRQF